MIILTEKELEELKRQIKEEILIENSGGLKSHISLEEAKATWFYGEGGYNKYTNSVMEQVFGTYRMHRVWDEVRKLTTHIFGKQYTQQLADFDSDVCNMVCDTICKTVVELRQSEEVQRQINNHSL